MRQISPSAQKVIVELQKQTKTQKPTNYPGQCIIQEPFINYVTLDDSVAFSLTHTMLEVREKVRRWGVVQIVSKRVT